MSVFRSFRFWIPFLIIVFMIIASFLVPTVFPDFEEEGPSYLKNEDGRIVAAPPYSPAEMPPLGSDKLGRDMFLLLLSGAKYTLISALIIAFLRMIGGFIFGVLFAFLPRWIRLLIRGIGDTFNFIPLAIVVFVLLIPLQGAFDSGALPSFRFLVIQIIVIALVVIPSLGMYLGEEMNEYMKNDFVTASRQMGASSVHIIKKHIWSQFNRYGIVMFSEQLTQTLLLLIQLGILYICLGGLITVQFGIMENLPVYFSNTNEWAATMSINIKQVFLKPWLALNPLLFFAISIYCVNEISGVLRRVLIEGDVPKRNKEKGVCTNPNATSTTTIEPDFTFTNHSVKEY